MRVSVIVCTRNRAYAIAECLDTISAALMGALPSDEAEIVVVDNASEDDTSGVVKRYESSSKVPVRLLYEPKKGLPVARNRGIRSSQGDLVVFTDDDCRLSETFVSDLLRHDDSDSEPVLRGGRVELADPTDLPMSIKTSPTTARWHKGLQSAKHENIANAIVGCNMAVRRSVIERIGLFDERFGAGTNIPASEDTDWIYRAYLANVAVEYVPDMVVYHKHGRKSSTDGNKLMRNYAIGNGALYAKFFFKDPNLCRQFYWDCKAAASELMTRRNTFLPNIGFSHRDKVACALLGVARYLASAIKAQKTKQSAVALQPT